MAEINSHTCGRALDRAGLRQRWQEALAAGTSKGMADGLKTNEEALPGGFILTNTIASLLVQAGFIFVILFFELMRRPIGVRAIPNFLTYVEIVAAVSAAVSLPWALLAVWRFIRHGTPERSVKQIGTAVLESLEYEGCIDRRAGDFRVYSNRNDDGTVFCWVGGGSGKEQAIFLRALREVLKPIENPRYLLARRRIWRIVREDYFAVPDVLARKKEFAEVFASKWGHRVGPMQLIYTRTPEGRRLLLRARVHSLAAAFQKRSEHVSCWK
jgi:hypothetical protein